MPTTDLDALVSKLSLEQMIGQMFMGNISGGESVEFAAHNFERYHFGALQFSGVFEIFVRGGDYLPCGVCRNAPLEEVAAFLDEVKRVGREITGLPVLMAGDQEGSISNSIFRRRQVAIMPSQMGLGAAGDPELAYRCAQVSAREVKVLGLDMVYGPCLDVQTNTENPEIGARSFSQDPEVVAIMGEQVVRAYAAEGMISNIKHFPGRGAGASDAHRELESIPLSREQLERCALLPFRRALAAGADSVMMAHTLYPALEPERLPASLSPRILTGLLREELGFDGLVIPDDLSMFAISDNFGMPQAAAMCLEAGADMVFTKVPERYAPTIEAIKESLRAGRLTEERLAQSVQRILRLKQARGLFEPAPFSAERVLATVGCPEHMAVAQEAANRAMVLVKNRGEVPLSGAPALLTVAQRDLNVVLSNDPVLSHEMLPTGLRQFYPQVDTVLVEVEPTVPQAYEAVGRAKNAEVIVAGVYSAGLSEAYRKLLEELVALGKPVIVSITNSPAAAMHLPEEVAAVICQFGLSTFAFRALAEVLAGKLAATGTLPVKLEPYRSTDCEKA
ncbi:MAG: glycoside hydrolase family 3 protein [candidate division WS1 bacterium]|nr:glycoside hydrolase family 3 protein [candidate division WS1 bacterium]